MILVTNSHCTILFVKLVNKFGLSPNVYSKQIFSESGPIFKDGSLRKSVVNNVLYVFVNLNYILTNGFLKKLQLSLMEQTHILQHHRSAPPSKFNPSRLFSNPMSPFLKATILIQYFFYAPLSSKAHLF